MLRIRTTKIDARNTTIIRAVLSDDLGNLVTIIYDTTDKKVNKIYDNVHLMQSVVEKFDMLKNEGVKKCIQLISTYQKQHHIFFR